MALIKVDVEKCIGCGACVNSCPVNIFKIVNEKAKPSNIDKCILCRACERACPAGAIKVSE